MNGKFDAQNFTGMSAAEMKQVADWLNVVCGERTQIPVMQFTTIHLAPKDPSLAVFDKKLGYTNMDQSELGAEIDRLLDSGHFVQYVHDRHAVAIVGRTEDCRYIIQDSIPEPSWKSFGHILKSGDVYKSSARAKKDQAKIGFKSQNFQYWPRALVLKNAVTISYAQSQVPIKPIGDVTSGARTSAANFGRAMIGLFEDAKLAKFGTFRR